MNFFYDNRCNSCGKFCKPVDWGVYYGSTEDLEPPEPVPFCQKCVTKHLKKPQEIIIGCWWIKPSFVLEAEKIRYDKSRTY